MNSNHVLRTYRMFMKNHFMEFDRYLVKSNTYRICLNKFRVSSQRLKTEVGRHKKVPKIYIYCNENELNDEVHPLKSCQFHNESRRIPLKSIQHNFSSITLRRHIDLVDSIWLFQRTARIWQRLILMFLLPPTNAGIVNELFINIVLA